MQWISHPTFLMWASVAAVLSGMVCALFGKKILILFLAFGVNTFAIVLAGTFQKVYLFEICLAIMGAIGSTQIGFVAVLFLLAFSQKVPVMQLKKPKKPKRYIG